MDSAIDGVFLIPHQSTLDVHVFERKGVFGADQCGQGTDLKRGVLPRLQLNKALWHRSIEVGQRFVGGEERRRQGRNSVSARLHVKLKPAIGLLNEYLPVT